MELAKPTSRQRVVFIAMDQPLDSDADLRREMINVEERAKRQASRLPGLDRFAMLKEVTRNLLKLPLQFQGRYLGLPI